MALFGLIFLFVMLVLIGVGIALGLVASVIAAVLVGLGVLSSSVVVGVLARRTSAGVRAFFSYQCASAAQHSCRRVVRVVSTLDFLRSLQCLAHFTIRRARWRRGRCCHCAIAGFHFPSIASLGRSKDFQRHTS